MKRELMASIEITSTQGSQQGGAQVNGQSSAPGNTQDKGGGGDYNRSGCNTPTRYVSKLGRGGGLGGQLRGRGWL